MLLNLRTLTCFIGLSDVLLLFCLCRCESRLSTILQQLEDLKALTHDGVLPNDEFLAQKESFLKELNDL